MNTAGTESDIQQQRDEQHLNLLSIFYYIYGGLTLVSGCLGLIYIFAAAAIFASPEIMEDEDVPAALISGIMVLVGGCALLFGLGLGALIIYAGQSLSRHRNYVYCMVIAALICLSIPLGTILGVFTFIVLTRPSVKALFGPQTG